MAPRRFPAGPVLSTAALMMLGLYAWLARYAHPMADDLAFAATGRTGGFLQLQVERWLLWNGRFSSNIPILNNPLVGGLDGLVWYRLWAVVLIALTVQAFQFLARSIAVEGLARSQAWTVALTLTAAQLTLMPDIGDGLYWYTGSMTYQTAVITGLWYAALWLRMDQGRWLSGPVLHGFLMALVLLFFIGTNEVSMAMAVLFHAGVVLLTFAQRRPVGALTGVLVVTALAGSALMFFAPGNAGREWQYTGTRLLGHSLFMSLAQSVRFTALWLMHPLTLSGSLLLVLGFHRLPAGVQRMALDLHRHRRALLLLPFALVFVAAFPAYWSTGILGQHRTIDQACGFFLPAWCLVVLAWRAGRGTTELPHPAWAGTWTPVLFCLSLALTGNGARVLDDLLSGRAASFDRSMTARFDLLQQAATDGSNVVRVPPIAERPRALMFMDLSAEPSFWVNQAHAQYFGLLDERIVLDPGAH